MILYEIFRVVSRFPNTFHVISRTVCINAEQELLTVRDSVTRKVW